jgi:hypothetical protein
VLLEEIVEVGDFPEPKGIGDFTAVEGALTQQYLRLPYEPLYLKQ